MIRCSTTWLMTVAALALAGACDEPLPEKTPRKQALDSITSDVLIPMLGELRVDAEQLGDTVHALCESDESRTADHLDDARKAWGDTCASWKRTDVMAFGPHTMSPYRFASDIDFWPAREDSIDALLLGGSSDAGVAADDAGAVDGELPDLPEALSAAQKGLPAIEYLLFAPGDETLAAFRDGARGDRRCQYLVAMADQLLLDSRELGTVFRDEFAPDFTLERNPNDHYSSVNDAFGELVNNMIFAVETVRGTRLAKPLGLTSGGVPQPDTVESRYSEQSIRAAVAVLEGVADVFYGRNPADPDSSTPIYGIHSVLLARQLDLRSEYTDRHGAAVAALEAIPEPLSEAVVDDPQSVEAARAAITDLLMLLQVDIAQALSVTATFGRNDGDGD